MNRISIVKTSNEETVLNETKFERFMNNQYESDILLVNIYLSRWNNSINGAKYRYSDLHLYIDGYSDPELPHKEIHTHLRNAGLITQKQINFSAVCWDKMCGLDDLNVDNETAKKEIKYINESIDGAKSNEQHSDNREIYYFEATKAGKNRVESILINYLEKIEIWNKIKGKGRTRDKFKEAYQIILEKNEYLCFGSNKENNRDAMTKEHIFTDIVKALGCAGLGCYGVKKTEYIDPLRTRLCIEYNKSYK